MYILHCIVFPIFALAWFLQLSKALHNAWMQWTYNNFMASCNYTNALMHIHV
jgi:hypothetical protein